MMPQLQFQRYKPTAVQLVVLAALLTGVVTFSTNLFITANTFRRTLEQDHYLRVRRTINLMTILRNELARLKEQIATGRLDAAISETQFVPPKESWPAQMWAYVRWSSDLLNVDTEVIKMLSSIYDQINQANSLIVEAKDAERVELATRGSMNAMTTLFAAAGAPVKRMRDKNPEPPLPLMRSVSAHESIKAEISKRLPDVLTAIDLAISKLQEEAKR